MSRAVSPVHLYLLWKRMPKAVAITSLDAVFEHVVEHDPKSMPAFLADVRTRLPRDDQEAAALVRLMDRLDPSWLLDPAMRAVMQHAADMLRGASPKPN